MIKFVFKLVKIAVILLIIAALFVGFCYVGDEFLDIDFCEEVIDEIEDIFANASSESGEKNKNDGVGTYELHYNFMLDGAELASGATNTSKNLVESLYEALSTVENLNK